MVSNIINTIEIDNLHKESVEEMIRHYTDMRFYHTIGKSEEVGLHGGKFCEHAANLVLFVLDEQIIDNPEIEKILQQIDKSQNISIDQMIRVTIPRMIRAAYEIRNKRDTVHVNRKIKVNDVDARAILSICGWILAEFIRAYGTKDIEKASKMIDYVSKVDIPFIDDYKGKKMIMNSKLTVTQEILIHLMSVGIELDVNKLVEWIPDTNLNHIRTVLRQQQRKRTVHYERDLAKITPLGIKEVEEIIKLNQ